MWLPHSAATWLHRPSVLLRLCPNTVRRSSNFMNGTRPVRVESPWVWKFGYPLLLISSHLASVSRSTVLFAGPRCTKKANGASYGLLAVVPRPSGWLISNRVSAAPSPGPSLAHRWGWRCGPPRDRRYSRRVSAAALSGQMARAVFKLKRPWYNSDHEHRERAANCSGGGSDTGFLMPRS